jgi:hypothetical protein
MHTLNLKPVLATAFTQPLRCCNAARVFQGVTLTKCLLAAGTSMCQVAHAAPTTFCAQHDSGLHFAGWQKLVTTAVKKLPSTALVATQITGQLKGHRQNRCRPTAAKRQLAAETS